MLSRPEVNMKLNVAALSIAGAILWGASVFLVTLANVVVPDYGVAFLNMIAALYPGYHVGAGLGALLIGTAYAVVDGAIGGALLGWLYNLVAVSTRDSAENASAGHRARHRFGHNAH
jgi:hypothetical protein